MHALYPILLNKSMPPIKDEKLENSKLINPSANLLQTNATQFAYHQTNY